MVLLPFPSSAHFNLPLLPTGICSGALLLIGELEVYLPARTYDVIHSMGKTKNKNSRTAAATSQQACTAAEQQQNCMRTRKTAKKVGGGMSVLVYLVPRTSYMIPKKTGAKNHVASDRC